MNGAPANIEAVPAANETHDAVAPSANNHSDQPKAAEKDQMRTSNGIEDCAKDAKDAHDVPNTNSKHSEQPKKAEDDPVHASNGKREEANDVQEAHDAPNVSNNPSDQPKKAEDVQIQNDAEDAHGLPGTNTNHSDEPKKAEHEPKQTSTGGENTNDEKEANNANETSNAQGADADKQKESSSSQAAVVNKGKLSKQQKEVSQMIADTVSDEVAKQYTQATEIIRSAPDEGALQKASELLVKALKSAEDKDQAGLAYAELSLTYGQVMLGFVIRRATGGGVLGNGAEAAEEAEEDVVDEEEEEQITWTQLEIARVTFEKLVEGGNERLRARLAETHRTLGELLVALDQASQAGAEFGKASDMCEGRDRAECLHKLYLAMRREDKAVAGEALRKCIAALEGVGGAQDEDVLGELRDELRLFAGEGAERGGFGSSGGVAGGAAGGTAVKVVKVVPKRKREGGARTGTEDVAAKRERLG